MALAVPQCSPLDPACKEERRENWDEDGTLVLCSPQVCLRKDGSTRLHFLSRVPHGRGPDGCAPQKERAAYLSLGEAGSRLMMGKSGSLSTPCSCFNLYSFWRSTSWCRSRSLRRDEPSGPTQQNHLMPTLPRAVTPTTLGRNLLGFVQFWAEKPSSSVPSWRPYCKHHGWRRD